MSPTHYACAIIWRESPVNKEIEFLVINSRSKDPRTGRETPWQVKFPGGMNRVPDEPVSVTIQREVLEETHLAFLVSEGIWRSEVNTGHTKYGFLVNFADCRGDLRKDTLIDNGDEMSPPYWVPATTLGRELYHSHQAALLVACRELGIL